MNKCTVICFDSLNGILLILNLYYAWFSLNIFKFKKSNIYGSKNIDTYINLIHIIGLEREH